LQGQPEIRQPPAAPSPPQSAPVRRLDPDELAALLKRAQGLIDTGDLTSARLLLARAADAHEARAAFILAQTYDPDVLGTADARSITPDPATARLWYQKAASFGSPEAQLRLAQMNN
jgi:TPR repeat protein